MELKELVKLDPRSALDLFLEKSLRDKNSDEVKQLIIYVYEAMDKAETDREKYIVLLLVINAFMLKAGLPAVQDDKNLLSLLEKGEFKC